MLLGDMWESLVAGEPLSDVQLARFTTLNSHVIALCVDEAQQILPRFGNTCAVHSRRAVLHDVASEPQPFAVVTSANERKTSADTVAPRHYSCGSGRGRRGSHCGK